MQALYGQRDALAATDTHGDQTIAAFRPLKFVHGFHRQDCPCSANWMAERNRPSVRIDFRLIEAKRLVHGTSLSSKGLV